MNCRNCQYALWNLRARECPECGAPFSPRDFEFVPNSVRFCCPGCGQAYYGTDAMGRLEPADFECVCCGRQTGMDDMVLLPAEGVDEFLTSPGTNPWLERAGRNWLTSWFATIGQSMVGPVKLMRGTPLESPLPRAFWFAALTQGAAMLVAALPLALLIAMPMMGSGSGANAMGVLLAASAFSLGAGFVFLVMAAVLWALAAHLLLVITGRERRPLRRTMQAILYASGANALIAIPCMGHYIGMPWWVVSAVLMVKEGHGIRGGRASFAVLTPPLLVFLAFVAFYVVMIVMAINSSNRTMRVGMGISAQEQHVQAVVQALMASASNQGRWPGHGSELVADGRVYSWFFMDSNSATTPADVPMGAGTTLDDLPDLADGEQRAVVTAAAMALPPGVVAHRVGDIVFTYHGIDAINHDQRLWLAVMCADPRMARGAAPGDVVVGSGDGTVATIAAPAFSSALMRQNALRAAAGLPPLPDPRTVRHGAPPVAGPAPGTDPEGGLTPSD